MKSIYQKITFVLILGFVIQIILVGVFYKQVALKRIITDINDQGTERNAIMQEAVSGVQKFNNKPEKIKTFLDSFSKKNSNGFIVKNEQGEIIYTSKKYLNNNSIEEQGYVKVQGKITYTVHGYFPEKLNIRPNIKQARERILTVVVLFFVSIGILLIIYKTITGPLKKLGNAINDLNYGNTLVDIPYYGEDELGLLCRNVESMGKRLRKSEKNQQELIQAISHDVKTPLTSIVGYSKRILDEKVTIDKKKEYIEIINRKANDLRVLLEELDEYANINSENKYNKINTNCKSHFEEVCSELQFELKQKGSELTYSYFAMENCNVYMDSKKIKRVFINIVENSIKYVGEKCNVQITASFKEKEIIYRICDNGQGVPEDQISRIFDRFYRVDLSRNREKGGTGLGLAICKEIIEKHKGVIGAELNPLGGLCIWFTLPVS